MDGAALIHTLDPKQIGAKTFSAYASIVFIIHL